MGVAVDRESGVGAYVGDISVSECMSGGHQVFEWNREFEGFVSGVLVNFMLPSRSFSQQLRQQDTVQKDFPLYTIDSKPIYAVEASS